MIGTSGFSYDDWEGPFYPPGLPREERLQYYSLLFPFVELDYSYYKMPEARSLAGMAAKTHSGFLFAVKGHRSITHDIDPADWRGSAELFMKGVEPLAREGRLAGILLQFPYSFHYSDDRRLYLGNLLAYMAELPLFVEFRNDEWRKESVFGEMRKRGIGSVAVDTPPLPGLPARSLAVTADSAYIRFHGRNAASWWSGDNVSRYDYLYTEEELAPWVPDIKDMEVKVKRLLIAFNNHHKAQAVMNARQLEVLLGLRETDENSINQER